MAVDAAPAGHDRVAVKRLELVEIAVIHKPCDNLAVVGWHLGVAADDAVDFLDRIGGRARRLGRLAGQGFFAQMADDLAGDGQRVGVILGKMVGHTRHGRVHLAAAQFFGIHLFAGGSKGQFRPAKIHEALATHDHHLIAERRDIGTASGARPHDDSDLRHPVTGHADLLVKDRSELPLIGENVFLIRQEGTAGIHQRDNRKTVLPGNLLGAHVLARGHAEIGAALNGSVIGDDHALAALDHTDAGDDAATRWHAIIFVQPGKLPDFQKGGARVDQPLDPFPRQDLALLHVSVPCLFGTANALQKPKGMQLADFVAILCIVLPEVIGPGIE